MGRGRGGSAGIIKLRQSKPPLPVDTRIKLASAVEQYPEIWKLDHPRYKLRDTHGKSWEAIAKIVEITVDECKAGWKAMRDALRYRRQCCQNRGKSGDSGGEEVEGGSKASDDDHLTAWVFWDSMKFFALQKSTRSTLSSLPSHDEDAAGLDSQALPTLDATVSTDKHAMQEEEIPPNSDTCPNKRSNYDYTGNIKKRKRSDTNGDTSTDRIAAGIEDLIKMRKESQSQQQTLCYQSIYSNLDRMLSQLPPMVVEELNAEFISITLQAIKRQNVTNL